MNTNTKDFFDTPQVRYSTLNLISILLLILLAVRSKEEEEAVKVQALRSIPRRIFRVQDR
jgi:hypothetical protein